MLALMHSVEAKIMQGAIDHTFIFFEMPTCGESNIITGKIKQIPMAMIPLRRRVMNDSHPYFSNICPNPK
jgi:hypothetical protein